MEHSGLLFDEIINRDNGDQGQQQRKKNPLHPLTDHSAKAVPLEDEHREEAADQKKQRHPEHVDCRIGNEEEAVLVGVLNGPRGRNKTQQGMKDNAQ